MSGRFLHFGFNPHRRSVVPEKRMSMSDFQKGIEAYFDKTCEDWYRYGAQNYVVYTDVAAKDLANGLKAVQGFEQIACFATSFDPSDEDANGLMIQDFWDWLWKSRI